MKNILIAAAVMAMTFTATAQEFDKMDKSPMDAAYYPAQAPKRAFAKTDEQKMAQQPQIRVLYSRPSLNDRAIFTATDVKGSGITKFGEKWRVGANESTEITFMKDAMIDGKEVKAGRYSMLVVPMEEQWMVHINSEVDAWGHYSHNANLDVATMTIPVTAGSESLENLSMTMYSPSENMVHLKMGWGTYRAELPITLL
jgi:hypothetical protein